MFIIHNLMSVYWCISWRVISCICTNFCLYIIAVILMCYNEIFQPEMFSVGFEYLVDWFYFLFTIYNHTWEQYNVFLKIITPHWPFWLMSSQKICDIQINWWVGRNVTNCFKYLGLSWDSNSNICMPEERYTNCTTA